MLDNNTIDPVNLPLVLFLKESLHQIYLTFPNSSVKEFVLLEH